MGGPAEGSLLPDRGQRGLDWLTPGSAATWPGRTGRAGVCPAAWSRSGRCCGTSRPRSRVPPSLPSGRPRRGPQSAPSVADDFDTGERVETASWAASSPRPVRRGPGQYRRVRVCWFPGATPGSEPCGAPWPTQGDPAPDHRPVWVEPRPHPGSDLLRTLGPCARPLLAGVPGDHRRPCRHGDAVLLAASGTANPADAHFLNLDYFPDLPNGEWLSWPEQDPPGPAALAFRLEGEAVESACRGSTRIPPAAPVHGECQEVTVTFDSTGMKV